MIAGGGSGGRGGASGGGNRAEADRWLVTSEKLLASNDLPGAKTFAIRACEADPTRAEAADYILAICDVLIAGDTKLGGDSNLPDWYAVLRLGRLAQNPEHVATQYRRLTLLLNPSVNRLPFADRAFKLVADAWFVLSDPSRKAFYDRELQVSQLGHSGFQSQWKSQEPSSSVAKPGPSTAPPAFHSQARATTDPTETSFWTACPYCFTVFEYLKAYEECTLRCQECRRAFQAVKIQKPPVEGKGDDVNFGSWAVFPLGFSGEYRAASWSPISPLFACPFQKVDGEVITKKRKEQAPPRIYYDDDDIYVSISDDDCEEEGDWQNEVQVSKKSNVGKGKEPVVRSNKKNGAEKTGKGIQNVGSIGGGASNPAVTMTSNAAGVGSSSGVMSTTASYATRKRTGTGAKNLGRLDLNVEFSNEVEEPAVAGGRNEGNGLGSNREVDNMEGIGFFEGLDEFLSSLPILSVVGDDKIKAT